MTGPELMTNPYEFASQNQSDRPEKNQNSAENLIFSVYIPLSETEWSFTSEPHVVFAKMCII